ncbi:ImuA family protein [Mucilaginibacter antarcticus]|uniref:ImuA family protein n=1 Tax=Mucilaginibacter antarcticus TaxID=1855725 RepID=A0ABW5XPK9_9SPHI
MLNAQKDIVSKLQKDILAWQGFSLPKVNNVNSMGLGPLESAFPNGIFPTGTIHEMLCYTLNNTAATCGLLSGLLASLMAQGGTSIWISTSRKLYPSALGAFGVDAGRFIFIDVQRERDILWVMEEALKCEGLAAVIAEIKEVSFAQSRRLQLAVETSKVTGFLLRNDAKKLGATTCMARWQVTPLPSALEEHMPGVGLPRWQVKLLRVRNGTPGCWNLQWTGDSFLSFDEQLQQETLTTIRQVG